MSIWFIASLRRYWRRVDWRRRVGWRRSVDDAEVPREEVDATIAANAAQ
jgi:hypothetical protein